MKKKWVKRLSKVMAGCMMLALTVCVFNKADAAAEQETENTAVVLEDSPEWVEQIPEAAEAQQLFVVAGIGQTTAYISMHEKAEDGSWKQIMTTPGYIGKYGLGKTKEGDGKTPVGVFGFNAAFGIAEDPGCAIPYKQVGEDDYWSGDQREGYSYNQMVSIRDLPDLNTEDSEHILDYTYQYQYCLNISYNAEGTPGLGSAIFLHCLGPQKPYTGGCVAIPKDRMITVMQNVKEDCVVVIDSLETLIPGLWEEWGLAPAESEPADGQQTVSAWLTKDDTSVMAVVDVSGGCSVDFALAAIYLYVGEDTPDGDASAMCLMLDKEVYEEYLAEAEASDTYREVEGGMAYIGEDGETYYLFTVDEKGYFLLDVREGVDGDALYARISIEAY